MKVHPITIMVLLLLSSIYGIIGMVVAIPLSIQLGKKLEILVVFM